MYFKIGLLALLLSNIAPKINNMYATPPSHKATCIAYLEKYAAKDLKGVADLFADDIVLRDWKIRVVGKELAVSETKKNFKNAESLSIDILHLHESENTVAAELKIVVNNTEVLYVVDIITFNDSGKITSIRAYLGRGDEE